MTAPYYMIEFNAGCCMFEVRINDIPVMTLDLPGQASSSAPVNFAILESGSQVITARVVPHSAKTTLDPGAVLDFKIKLFDVHRDFDFKGDVFSYAFSPVEPERKLPAMSHSATFTANVPYQLSGWKNGTPLKDVENVDQKLRKAYNQLATLISQGRYDDFKKFIANREALMARTMYLNPQQARRRIDRLVADFEDGFEMRPLPGDVVLQISGDGKVASFRKINGEHALSLIHEANREELMLDLAFYIPEGKTAFEIV